MSFQKTTSMPLFTPDPKRTRRYMCTIMTIISMSSRAWQPLWTEVIFAQNVKKDTTTNTSINVTTRVKCVESYTKRATKPGYIVPYATVTLRDENVSKCTRCKVKKAILRVEHTTDVNVDRPWIGSCTKRKKHKCGEAYCKVCRDFFPEGHKCYMQPETGICNLILKKQNCKYVFVFIICQMLQNMLYSFGSLQ